MATQDFRRKLTAILSADVKGYSRLMGEDEEATVRTITAHRNVVATVIQKYRGRVVDSPGDNILAEFASVVDAVQSAVEIQEVIRAKNAELPEDRRMEFRIGINLGDVIQEGERIYGDGVNIAARLEGLADPGGICISGSAYEQIENKLALGYEYMGEHTVKNIVKPVRVYKVPTAPETLKKVTDKRKPTARWQRVALAVVIALLAVAAGAVAIWKFYRPSTPPTETASVTKMAFPLPDKPSIAVLPFTNLSGDPKQEYFSDGITENIITALAKVPSLFVIARNSTFAYKRKPVTVKQVSEELGVQYVLEGSVQRSNNRIRITAQLIDALNGHHVWAERYDRDVTDLFALQDEITMKILTATRVKLTEGEQASSGEKYYRGKQGLDCYLKLTEANGIRQRWNIEDNNLARRMIEEANAMCPENPMGYVALGWVYYYDYRLGNTKSPRETLEKGIELAQKALAMDDSIAGAHVLLCMLYITKGEDDKAIAEGERAVALNPSDWSALNSYANSLRNAGRPEEAIPLYQKAIRLTPSGASILYRDFGRALRETRRFEEAVSAYKKAIQLAPNDISAHLGLAATYSVMSREQEARAEAAEVLRINSKFSLDSYAKSIPGKDRSRIDNYINALRQAGLK
jgi:adenylate cyclase